MQAYARDLLLRQVIGDSLNLAVNAMNNAHFFLALVKATQANKTVAPRPSRPLSSRSSRSCRRSWTRSSTV